MRKRGVQEASRGTTVDEDAEEAQALQRGRFKLLFGLGPALPEQEAQEDGEEPTPKIGEVVVAAGRARTVNNGRPLQPKKKRKVNGGEEKGEAKPGSAGKAKPGSAGKAKPGSAGKAPTKKKGPLSHILFTKLLFSSLPLPLSLPSLSLPMSLPSLPLPMSLPSLPLPMSLPSLPLPMSLPGAGSLVPSEEAASAMVAVLEGAKTAAAKISEAARAAAGPQRAASGVRGQPQNAGATAGAAPRAVAGAKGQGAGAERRAGAAPGSPPSARAKGQGASAGAARKALSGARGQGAGAGRSTGAAPGSPPSAGAKGQGASAGAARKALSGARGQGASAGGSTGAAPESPPSEGSLGQGASAGAARRALSGARGQGPSAGSAPMAVPGARGQGTSAGAAPRAVAGARGPGTTAAAAARALVPVTARTNQQAFVTRAELEAVRAEILRAIAHAPLVPGTAPGWHVNPITQHPFATKLFAVAMRRAFTRRGVHLVVWKSRMVAFALFTLENPLLEKATDGKLSNDQSENRTKFHETCDRVRRWVEHSVLKLAVPYDRAAQAYVFGGHGVCIDASDFPQLPRT
ncbi:unnamed protein product [Closterium sp. NIES-64]|nr:unnamed protein product [Closterium sp. NIES-64]